MLLLQALLFLTSFVLVALAAFGVRAGRVNLALLGAAAFILGYALPAITTAI